MNLILPILTFRLFAKIHEHLFVWFLIHLLCHDCALAVQLLVLNSQAFLPLISASHSSLWNVSFSAFWSSRGLVPFAHTYHLLRVSWWKHWEEILLCELSDLLPTKIHGPKYTNQPSLKLTHKPLIITWSMLKDPSRCLKPSDTQIYRKCVFPSIWWTLVCKLDTVRD